MKEIRAEFETFLAQLLASYPKATNNVLANPASLSEVGSESRDFNSKSKNKIDELISKNKNVDSMSIKLELSGLHVAYHGKLMSGHL